MTREATSPLAPRDTYGDPQAEYRAFLESCALVVRADRGAVRVTGERRSEMLNGLVTNDVAGLTEAGRPALQLSAKGRVLTDMRVFPRPDSLLIDVPRTGLENLLATFKKYLPPIYARYEDVSAELAHVGVYGPGVAVLGEALGATVPEPHLGITDVGDEGDGPFLYRDRRMGDGLGLIGPQSRLTEIWLRLEAAVEECGGRPAGTGALEAVRVEWGVPRYADDISDENLPQETGLTEAISHEKGCYLGQEVVARIHFRGHVNRHLRSLEFDSGPPAPGSELVDPERGRAVGVVTSSVVSPEFGPIGLGYVRREIEPGAALSCAGAEATVRAKPFRSAAG